MAVTNSAISGTSTILVFLMAHHMNWCCPKSLLNKVDCILVVLLVPLEEVLSVIQLKSWCPLQFRLSPSNQHTLLSPSHLSRLLLLLSTLRSNRPTHHPPGLMNIFITTVTMASTILMSWFHLSMERFMNHHSKEIDIPLLVVPFNLRRDQLEKV